MPSLGSIFFLHSWRDPHLLVALRRGTLSAERRHLVYDFPQTERHRHRLSGLGCKIAGTFDEWCDAFSLIHDCYVRSGLSEPRVGRMRVIPHHLLQTSSVLIAQFDRSIIGTLTLIRDSGAGLPMEIVYADEVAGIRSQGISIAEVSCLATQPLSRSDYPYVCMRLMRLVGQHARFLGVERLLIVTHPRHAPFYERMMGFRRIGAETSYPTVGGAPAVAASLDFHEVDRIRPRYYDQFLGSAIHPEVLAPKSMPDDVAEYFCPLTAHLDFEEVSGSAPSLDRQAELALAGVADD